MFAVVSKVDHGFEDESFRAAYGDHVADEATEDIEDRLIAMLDGEEFEPRFEIPVSYRFSEIVAQKVAPVELAPEFAALDARIEEEIIADIHAMDNLPLPVCESGRRLALNGVMHDKVAGITRGHDRRKMQRGGGNYARRATTALV